jgi:hypothetical protein
MCHTLRCKHYRCCWLLLLLLVAARTASELWYSSLRQVYSTQSVCSFLSTNQPWKQYLQGGNFTLMPPLVPGEQLQLSGTVGVTPAAVPHRAEFSDAVGYYIKASLEPGMQAHQCRGVAKALAGPALLPNVLLPPALLPPLFTAPLCTASPLYCGLLTAAATPRGRL